MTTTDTEPAPAEAPPLGAYEDLAAWRHREEKRRAGQFPLPAPDYSAVPDAHVAEYLAAIAELRAAQDAALDAAALDAVRQAARAKDEAWSREPAPLPVRVPGASLAGNFVPAPLPVAEPEPEPDDSEKAADEAQQRATEALRGWGVKESLTDEEEAAPDQTAVLTPADDETAVIE